jgi:hypothetical protein
MPVWASPRQPHSHFCTNVGACSYKLPLPIGSHSRVNIRGAAVPLIWLVVTVTDAPLRSGRHQEPLTGEVKLLPAGAQ